jgi:segregation and condensation protein B
LEKIERESFELLSEEKLKRNLALLEAALYVAGRPLDSKTLGSIIKTRSKSKIQKLVRILMDKYESCESALEILELEDQRFVLQLKTEFSPQVQRLAIRPLLSKGPLKTLSYTAFRQPVLQSQVVDVRGHHAYGHLRQLEDMGLISRERVGRSRLLRTTGFFADFFGLSHDLRTMKRQLKRVFEDFEKAEPEKE